MKYSEIIRKAAADIELGCGDDQAKYDAAMTATARALGLAWNKPAKKIHGLLAASANELTTPPDELAG